MKTETRHLTINGIRTTILLETPFWELADKAAANSGEQWYEWAIHRLEDKPPKTSRAGWLRLAVLQKQ